jgi:hypothetical protein
VLLTIRKTSRPLRCTQMSVAADEPGEHQPRSVIRIVLADDHAVVRSGLRLRLTLRERWVCAIHGRASEPVRLSSCCGCAPWSAPMKRDRVELIIRL